MKKNKSSLQQVKSHTPLTQVFLSCTGELRTYLKRFFCSTQDIEDVLQETYIKAIESEKHQDIKLPRPFLYRISKNLALNIQSSAASRLTDAVADFDQLAVLLKAPEVEETVEHQQMFAQFCRSVSLLPPQCRKVMVLKKVYGLGNQEIADKLEISVSTVDKHLAKGLLMSREYMQNKGYNVKSGQSHKARENKSVTTGK